MTRAGSGETTWRTGAGTGRLAAGLMSICRHSRPARWISAAIGARSETITSASRSRLISRTWVPTSTPGRRSASILAEHAEHSSLDRLAIAERETCMQQVCRHAPGAQHFHRRDGVVDGVAHPYAGSAFRDACCQELDRGLGAVQPAHGDRAFRRDRLRKLSYARRRRQCSATDRPDRCHAVLPRPAPLSKASTSLWRWASGKVAVRRIAEPPRMACAWSNCVSSSCM